MEDAISTGTSHKSHDQGPGCSRAHRIALNRRRDNEDTYRHERGDLLAVFDELHTHALPDGRVGLLGLNADLLQDDALCVGRASSGGGLVDVTEGTLLVRLIRLQMRN